MEEKNQDLDQKAIEEIVEAIRRLKYGEVVVTVYNSKIVQVEKREKKRFV